MKKEQRAMHLSPRLRRKSCVLFTSLWIQYKKKKEKKRSIRSINPLKLIRRVLSVVESKT